MFNSWKFVFKKTEYMKMRILCEAIINETEQSTLLTQ
jgi:hypothetical protein